MEAKGEEVAGLSMSLEDIIKQRSADNRGRGRGSGRGREGRGRGRGREREGRGAERHQHQHQHRQQQRKQGPRLQLSFEWGKEGEEEVFTAEYDGHRIVEIKSNGDVVVNSGGSKGADMLAALNYVCQQIRVKIAVTDEGEWSIQHVDGRWQQRFTDQLKCSAFPRRAWHAIKATLEALPSAFHPNDDNDYITGQDEHAGGGDAGQATRKRKPQVLTPPMPLLPFPPPFPFMPIPPPMLMPQAQQHGTPPAGFEGRGRGRGRGGARRAGSRTGRGESDARGAPSKRARQYRQF